MNNMNMYDMNKEFEKILTISVAAYNAEKYLKKCLNSFVAAKYLKYIEVLIINDGSKDRTLEIAGKYEKKYPMSFKVVDKENGGHGSTINCAISIAKGKYFKVIDSDDWIKPSELDKLVLFLKNVDADMVISHFDWVTYDCRKCIRHFNMLPERLSYNKIYQFKDISDRMLVKMHSVTFRTAILQKNDIKIDENCFYVDQEFCMYPILYCRTVAFIDADITQYRLGQSGQSMSRDSMQKNVLQHYHVLLELINYYENAKHDKAPKHILRFMQKHISYMVGSQIKIYLSFPASSDKKNDIIKFDKKIRSKYPEIYNKVENKAVWLLRKTHYSLYRAAVFALRLLWR